MRSTAGRIDDFRLYPTIPPAVNATDGEAGDADPCELLLEDLPDIVQRQDFLVAVGGFNNGYGRGGGHDLPSLCLG
jgi:hypothetical protein